MAALTGRIVVAGNGPEQPVIHDLGMAFEKANPGTAIDIEWDKNLKPVQMVRSGRAQVAVTGAPDPELRATPIAWDGVAVIVNFANPVAEVTSEQVRGLFTGAIQRWSELDGSDARVEPIRRPPDRNLQAFEQILGIGDQLTPSTKVLRSDDSVLRAVSGKASAVAYMSLSAALEAQEQGIPIRVLMVDKVDPGDPTVKDGRYKLRRPVLLLTGKEPDALTEAFTAFALSTVGQQIVDMMFAGYTTQAEQAKQA
jgi:phosphate transport system substrate-binding protein